MNKNPYSLRQSAGVLTHVFDVLCTEFVSVIRTCTPAERVMVVGFVLVLSLLVASSHQFEYKHHNNKELPLVLEEVHRECPNITRIYTLSETSVLGVPLYVIEFSTRPGHHEVCEWCWWWFLFFRSRRLTISNNGQHFFNMFTEIAYLIWNCRYISG